VLGVSLFCPGGVVTAAATPVTVAAESAKLDSVLGKISAAAAGVQTISSRMEQEKHLAAFNEVLKTSGRFAFQRPDCWRWELLQPVVSGISVCGQAGRRWHEDGGQPQSFKLADTPWLQHFAIQVTAWTTADFTFLKEQYAITLIRQNPPTLKLVPKESAARHLIVALEITFSPDYRYVERIVIRESGSDYTVTNFLDVVINKPLVGDYFK
jgi:outer membrane lipoprotein-sorting protein